MKIKIIVFSLFISTIAFAQKDNSSVEFKKRVLESAEVDFLASYYNQDGAHSVVSGGIGSEKLTDITSNIVIAMPLNDNDVLTVDLGISAYSSASSSNINPFNATGASGGGGDDDDDDDRLSQTKAVTGPEATPRQAAPAAPKTHH